jgi:hypothetical protein
MSVTYRTSVAVVLASALVGGAATTSAHAAPAPYNDGPTTTISTDNPPVGGTVGLAGDGYAPKELIKISIAPKVGVSTAGFTAATFSTQKAKKKYKLAMVKATRKGTYKLKLTLPRKYRCSNTLIAHGMKSGVTTKTPITIGNAKKCKKAR